MKHRVCAVCGAKLKKNGFAGSIAEAWPQTMVQRRLWHAFPQANRHTTSRPRLRAGIELRGLAVDLMHVEALLSR